MNFNNATYSAIVILSRLNSALADEGEPKDPEDACDAMSLESSCTIVFET